MSRQPRKPVWSLRSQLLTGILLPVIACIALNMWWSYRASLQALHTAYDRTLLASAKTIGEQLDVQGYDEQARIHALVPYSALEAFEADTRTRLYYRVSSLDGQVISGFDDLPFWRGSIPAQPPYAALVDFYDSTYRDQPVRIAVLLQPVASHQGRSMAVIQVAETLQLRHNLAWQLLTETLWQNAALLALLALTIMVVVQRITRSVREVGHAIGQRPRHDFHPLQRDTVPRELQPWVDGINRAIERLRDLLSHQKRFVRDASHQLRTPLAVLKVQVQSARQGDMPAATALQEIEATVDRATLLANQMLSLAKVEQLRQQPQSDKLTAWDAIVREVALDLAPLIADKLLDFELQADTSIPLAAHEWMLRELVRNLLHNAIRHAPIGSALLVTLTLSPDCRHANLHIIDQGPGLSEELLQRLYQPFSAGSTSTGSGLGLAICLEIVQALHGSLELHNRHQGQRIVGLQAVACLPVATPHSAPGLCPSVTTQ
ncbi:sensor histidine kinase N-terminal domain-containing protein [Comamonas sp.]|uniref:sensor histidine kinase n=1 Tax=Comamonas sp. TaxID=34028 RepID=UPI00289EC699|nr:sensor histidine kinase N-terminal domain-containing protein [Comamonas sp.]